MKMNLVPLASLVLIAGVSTASASPAVLLAKVSQLGRGVDRVCSITAAKTAKTSKNKVKVVTTKYTANITNGSEALQIAALLGEKTLKEIGPTDSPTVVATVYDRDGEAHLLSATEGGVTTRDASPSAADVVEFVNLNCPGIL